MRPVWWPRGIFKPYTKQGKWQVLQVRWRVDTWHLGPQWSQMAASRQHHVGTHNFRLFRTWRTCTWRWCDDWWDWELLAVWTATEILPTVIVVKRNGRPFNTATEQVYRLQTDKQQQQGVPLGWKVGDQNILLSACLNQGRRQELTEGCFYLSSSPPLPFLPLPSPSSP